MTIAEKIMLLCKKEAISINKMCSMAKIPPSTVKNILNGITKNIGINTIYKICCIFHISIADFFEDVEIL